MFHNLDRDEFRIAMTQLAKGNLVGPAALKKRLNGTKAEIEASMPDLTIVSADVAAELHAMIPGFKSWPFRTPETA